MKKRSFLVVALLLIYLSGCKNTHKNRIILLMGQSNAVGCTSLFGLKDYKENVYNSSKEGYENILLSSYCDFHTESSEFERNLRQLEAYNGFGPEIGIAHKLSKRNRNENFYILKTAWGGTTIDSNWLNGGNRAYHYNISMNYITSKLNELKNNNVSIDSITICWMQGESDGSNEDTALRYQVNEKALFTYFRNDLKSFCNKVGIVDAFISTRISGRYDSKVNEAKFNNSKELKDIKIIRTNGERLGSLKLTFPEGENSHYDSKSMYKLGVAFAKKAIKLF